jgi:hypothetical protein
MLAEIYLLRLQTLLRDNPSTSSTSATAGDPRFVPITLPRA